MKKALQFLNLIRSINIDLLVHFALCYILADLFWTIPVALKSQVPVHYACLCVLFVFVVAIVMEWAGASKDNKTKQEEINDDINLMDLTVSVAGAVFFFFIKWIQHLIN
jgi:prolipoprotein diacylglyceryltransferase